MVETEASGESGSHDLLEESYINFSNEDLVEILNDLLQKNEKLKSETTMYAKHLQRISKKLEVEETEQQATGQADSPGTSNRLLHQKHSKSRTAAADRALKLTAEQKCDIAQSEIEDYRQEIEKNKINSEKIIDSYKAVMEEADIRHGEILKLQYEFDRDVVKGGVNPISKTVISEKFVRHFEERLRQRDTLIDKLRLKNSTLRQQRLKLNMQLKQKEEMGEVLNEVDFKQMKIENEQYLEKIEIKNQELMHLKLMSGHTLQVLNSYKKKLTSLVTDVTKIKSEINTRQDLFDRISIEVAQVIRERKKAEGTNAKLLQHMSDYRAPAVMEYVNCVTEQRDLNSTEKILIRKVDIAKMALNRHKKIWNQARLAGIK